MRITTEQIKQAWEYIQDLADVKGDNIMLVMSLVFIWRVAMAAFSHPALTPSEAGIYSAAIAAFAYSNKQ